MEYYWNEFATIFVLKIRESETPIRLGWGDPSGLLDLNFWRTRNKPIMALYCRPHELKLCLGACQSDIFRNNLKIKRGDFVYLHETSNECLFDEFREWVVNGGVDLVETKRDEYVMGVVDD